MHKDRFYIGITIIVVILTSVLFAAFVVNERQEQENVAALRSRVAEIEARYRQHRATAPPAIQEEVPDLHAQEEKDLPVRDEDAITAFRQLTDKMPVTGGAMQEKFLKEWDELSEDEKEDLVAFLDDNRDLILELRRLAAAGGPFHDLDLSSGFAIELPHLSKLRDAARLLAANMKVAAARGDHESVTEDAVAIMRLADALGSEPHLISQLVRGAMYQSLYVCAAQHLRGDNMPPELLERMLHHGSGESSRNMLADALTFEASWGVAEAFDSIRQGTDPSSNTLIMRLYGSIGRPVLNRDEEVYVDMMERASNAMGLPYYEAQPLLEQIRADAERLPRYHLISRPFLNILLPAYTNLPEALARCEAQSGLMQVGLAVEYYHGQHGKYPETLQAIAPILGGAMPLDPYTGQPFVYEPRQDGFTLYSARGRVVGPSDRTRPPLFDAQGNIIWRHSS